MSELLFNTLCQYRHYSPIQYVRFVSLKPSGKLRSLSKLDKRLLQKVRKLCKLYKKAGETKSSHPFNEERIAHYLRNHPDREAKFKLIIEGSTIGLKQDTVLSELSRLVNNMIFSKRDLIVMLERIIKELEKGFIAPGSGWYQLNLLCVPKKDNETGLMTEVRVARHASFAAPGSIALNDAIDDSQKGMKDDLALPSFLDYLWFFLSVCWVSLRDLKDAFRQLPLDPADQNIVQYSLFGLTFVDLRQAYGSASAANRCQEFSTTLKWMVANNSKHFIDADGRVLLELILAYIDDFAIGANDPVTCGLRTDAFDHIAEDINAPISVAKNITCVQRGVANGIGFKLDCTPKTVFVPKPKALDIVTAILGVIVYHWITAEALECLIGRILHWSQFDRRAKIFCNNALHQIYEDLRSMPKSKKLDTIVKANRRLIKSLDLYLRFFLRFREVPIVEILYEPSVSIIATSDASNLGGGFMCGQIFCAYTFATQPNRYGERHSDLHINQREAHAVLMLLWNCRATLTGRTVHFFIDNESVKFGMKKQWSSANLLVDWIQEITALALTLRVAVRVHYIPSRMNLPSDLLSRGTAGRREFDRLALVMNWPNLVEIQIPNHKHERYYECLRIMQQPIQIPEWTYYLPGRNSKYLNEEILKMWYKPRTLP